MSAPAVPEPWTRAMWESFESDERVELVEGLPVMAPPESPLNVFATTALLLTLGDAANSAEAPAFRLGTTIEVDTTLGAARATYRVTDLVAVTPDTDIRQSTIPVENILLVVEVVSPSSARTDRVSKQAEYAAVGIPAYLIVDLRAGVEELILLQRHPGSEHYAEQARGRSIQVSLAGIMIPLSVDLLTR